MSNEQMAREIAWVARNVSLNVDELAAAILPLLSAQLPVGNEKRNAGQLRTDLHPLTCEDHSNVRLVAVGSRWVCPDRSCDYTQRVGGTPDLPPIEDSPLMCLDADGTVSILACKNCEAMGRELAALRAEKPQPVGDDALRAAAEAVGRLCGKVAISDDDDQIVPGVPAIKEILRPHMQPDRSGALVERLKALVRSADAGESSVDEDDIRAILAAHKKGKS